MRLLRQECKLNRKQLWIWALCIGIICVGCLFMFDSLKESIADMADSYSNMGEFSAAIGMDKLNIATMDGYYAIEISIIFSLGAAMFAAMLGGAIVSKEEEGHTSEFLNTLPLGRNRIIAEKYGAFLLTTVLFHIINVILIVATFLCMKDVPELGSLVKYHLFALLMSVEVGSLCFLISTISKKKLTGACIGIAVLLYMLDLLSNVVPALEGAKYVTPFHYCSASTIFAKESIEPACFVVAAIFTVGCIVASFIVYKKRDLN